MPHQPEQLTEEEQMLLSEYIRQLQELKDEYEDAILVFDDDTQFDHGHLPEFIEDEDGVFWVVST